MDTVWLGIDHDQLLLSVIDNVAQQNELEENNINLIFLYAKKLTSTQNLSDESVRWLKRLAIDFIWYYFCQDHFKLNDKGSQSKELVNIFKLSCRDQSVCKIALELFSEQLSKDLSSLNELGEEDSCEEMGFFSIEKTLLLIQVSFDCIKKNKIKINRTAIDEKMVSLCTQLIQMESISEKDFLVSNHILSFVIDITKEVHKNFILSSMEILRKRNDFKKLLLLLAMQLLPLSQSDVIKKTVFWETLKDGLVCDEPLARKRALYIIKCLLEVFSNETSFSSEFSEGDSTPVMSWQGKDSTDLWKVWKTFALFCETFEEKQMHVINPVLPLLNDVLKATNEKKLHYSWMLVILKRAMQHESKLLNTWAVQFCLHLDLSVFPLLSQPNFTFIFQTLFESLKNLFLYLKEEEDDNGCPPKILLLLTNFFESCFKAVDIGKQLEFLRHILDTFMSSTFNEMSLVYISKALCKHSMAGKLEMVDLVKLQEFLSTKIPIYKLEFRMIIFYNISQFYCNNLTITSATFESYISLLSHAYAAGLMKLHSKCWKLWVNLLQEDVSDIFMKKLASYLKGSGSSSDLMVLVQLIIDKHDSKNFVALFLEVTNVATKLSTNPYMSQLTVLQCLRFIEIILHENENQENENDDSMLDLILSYAPSIFEYANDFLKKIEVDDVSIQIIEKCFIIMECFVRYGLMSTNQNSFQSLRLYLSKYFADTLNTAAKGLSHIEDVNAQVLGLANFRMLYLALLWLKDKVLNSKYLFSQVSSITTGYDRKKLAALQKKDSTSTIINCDSFIVSCWGCLDLLLTHHNIFPDEQQSISIFEAFLSDTTMASSTTVLCLVGFAKQFVHLFKGNLEQLCLLIDVTWKIVKDQMHTDQTFWQIYQRSIEIVFHRDLLSSVECGIIDKVKDSWKLILDFGERNASVTTIAVEYFFNVWNHLHSNVSNTLFNYTDVLVQVGVFGPLRQKKEKPFNDLFSYLHKTKQYDNIKNLKSSLYNDQTVRTTFINFVLNLRQSEETTNLIAELLKVLIRYEQNLTKKSYFPNSEIHRKKLRAWQLVLIMLPKLPVGFDYNDLLEQMFLSCKTDNQTSIRYLAEWSIILCLQKDKNLILKLWKEMKSSTEKKIISVTFVLSITIHLSKILDDDDFEWFANITIPEIMPWANAQHRTSRIHSHIALELMWKRIQSQEKTAFKEKFSFLAFCFSLKDHNSSVVRHRRELLETFFFSKFHALNDFNLEFIFHTFLKHHGVMSDEFLDINNFKFIEDSIAAVCGLKLKKKGREEHHSDVLESTLAVSTEALYVDIQKKIMPWNIMPSDDYVLQSELSRKKDLTSSDLILCAVLVEKIPNLGGLCRTSEIFGVRKLLIASNTYVNDTGFKSLSVTSEKWVEIEQVIPIKLAEYLSKIKDDGYTIVGVEQTANSQMIGQFKFPKKTVLVLGNEKTGIPVDLIQLLDKCVEIPQLGIIRSLNVHISGAIMIWEYCKQHSF